MIRYIFSLILALLPLAYAQTPFPIAFESVNSAKASSYSSLISSYAGSLENQPAFTTFAYYMATATGLPPDEQDAFNEASTNPAGLALEFFTATATPAWYTEIPSDLQSYVSSVANGYASLATHVVGEADRLGARVAVMGALLTTALVGMLML
jgi:hypothetical protein